MEEIVFPLKPQMQTPAIAVLKEALRLLIERGALLADDEVARQASLTALLAELPSDLYGEATEQLVTRFQQERGLTVTGEVDEATANSLYSLLVELGIVSPTTLERYRVSGRVVNPLSASVGGLRVLIVDKFVGGDTLLVEAVTDSSGNYEAPFTNGDVRSGKKKPDIQARVFAGTQFLGASEVRYDAATLERLNVFLDEDAAADLLSEYETLTAALAAHYKGSLAALQETDELQDVTYMANKANWDARAVALAALAEQFSERWKARSAGVVIEPAFFYALFRSGLPATDEAILRTNFKDVETVWTRSIEERVIPAALQGRLKAAVQEFRQEASRQLLVGPVIAGASSFQQLLEISLPRDPVRQGQVADLYTQHGDSDPSAFWAAARPVLGDAIVDRLQLDGKLAYLTLNNAPLIRKLHIVVGPRGLSDPVDLVEEGFHRATAWDQQLGTDPLPPEIPGKDLAEKRQRYSELLAAQMRISFPTAVVADMVKEGDTPVPAALRVEVSNRLIKEKGEFEISQEPFARYVEKKMLNVSPEVVREITRIQRVYQLTPDHSAMNELLKQNVDSAYAVVRIDRPEFVRAFKDTVGGEQNAGLIHDKASQVHAAVLNVALTFITGRSNPTIGAGAGSVASIASAEPSATADANVLASATLEALFGELDYCTCEHCKSILSPAAYLVDLLLFNDRPSSEIPTGFMNPLTVLLDRRPDIQHLPLTCENTNTPLPYIDLVNETLEYFVANDLSLVGYKGHTTDGSATPEELLASPQFVDDAAYTALAGKIFPHPLPFHQPLEDMRRHYGHFDAPLAEVMEDLRKDDSLERASDDEYAWRDIWMETLLLSRAEHRLLTEAWVDVSNETDVLLTVKHLYGFDPATTEPDLRTVLENARSFTRRVEISYEQLFQILRTRFVNPSSFLIPRLERLGVSFVDLKRFKDGVISDSEFDDLVAPGVDPAQYGGDIKAWVRDDANFARIMGLVTLTNPGDPGDVCNFDQVELRYSNPDQSDNKLLLFEFIRLIRFIRLWKKLGWSIEQTDKAITTLYPPGQIPNDPVERVNLERLDAGFLVLLPGLGVLRRVMDLLSLEPDRDLLPLLASVAPIDTHGDSSLYHKMFLGLAQLDDVFSEDGYGNYLTDPDENLLDHAGTLRAAFSLTDTELRQITDALGFDADTKLTLDNISAVFRRGWLARKLRLSVRELLLFTEVTGYDPFVMPDPVGPAILKLIELLGRLRAFGFEPEQALYVIWNRDVSGKSAPAESEITGFARTLRELLAAIEKEFELVDDPDGSIARARMELVYGTEDTDFFFSLLENTFVVAEDYTHDEATLNQAILEASRTRPDGPDRIAYDDRHKRLSFSGYLRQGDADALLAVAGVSEAFKNAIRDLRTQNESIVDPFFDRRPELLSPYDTYVTSNLPAEEKRSVLLAAILPELKRRRKRQQALQAISSATDADVALAIALLENPDVLRAAGGTDPAVQDLTALEQNGLTAHFFFGDVGETPDVVRDPEAILHYTDGGENELPENGTTPGDPINGVWIGFLEAPENGSFTFRVDSDATGEVTLLVNGENALDPSSPIELRAGTLYAFHLTVKQVKKELSVKWRTTLLGFDHIPAEYLYSATLTGNLQLVYVRFLKAAALAAGFELTAAELAFLASRAEYQIDNKGWLNSLPVTDSQDITAIVDGLLKAFLALLEYARIKARHSPGDERLLEVLDDLDAATQDEDSLLYVITRWKKDSVIPLLARFGMDPPSSSGEPPVEVLRRIFNAYRWLTQLGVPSPVLLDATTNEPAADMVRELQAALRARFDGNRWLEILKPINDEMRSLRRDALVACILHRLRADPATAHIDTPERLFELFLMDVQIEPCMLTSRIRNALSSVQLFVERCLMNLEPKVSSASIKTKQWEWMKRYRVWEANRKIFLYPENWLEPELRDDQSPIFREVMSELLQGDITEDRAGEAFVNYLTKLEDVAKLEACGIHYVQGEPGTADDVAHVVARTAGANRKYFYRRREFGYWTPWEKVSLDIDDNPVLPVVWKGRLFLFWLKILQEKETDSALPPTPRGPKLADVAPSEVFPNEEPKLVVKAMLNWSELLGGEWQPTRTSDPARPLTLNTSGIGGTTTQGASGDTAFDRSELQLFAEWDDEGLSIKVSETASYFFLYNAFSTPETRESPAGPVRPRRILSTETNSLEATYPQSKKGTSHPVIDNLTRGIADRTVEPNHPMAGKPSDPPFFYEDNRHIFYVTTEERLVKVRVWNDFGVVVKSKKPTDAIAGLVFKPDKRLGKPPIPLVAERGFGVADPSTIDSYITEDAYIKTALGTPGTVPFGEKDIGPSGSQFTSNPSR